MAPGLPRRLPCSLAAATALLLALAAGSTPARAADPDVLGRLYYSSWMTGRIQQSPADPQGQFADSNRVTGNIKSEIEAIFLQRVGLSYSRQRVERQFTDPAGLTGCGTPPCRVQERALQQSLNLTLYGRAVTHNKFNLFAGGGAGTATYEFLLNEVPQTSGDLYNGLSLSRWFYGVEYTFDRIGFRLEVSNVSAHKTVLNQTARLDESFRYLTLVIPLN